MTREMGARWMPRRAEPMKGAAQRRNASGSRGRRGAEGARMGQPAAVVSRVHPGLNT